MNNKAHILLTNCKPDLVESIANLFVMAGLPAKVTYYGENSVHITEREPDVYINVSDKDESHE